MCCGVCGVFKLTGDDAAGYFCVELLCLLNCALHAQLAVGEHELSAVSRHEQPALNGHGVRHDNDDTVASGSADSRNADTGVAACRLDDRAALAKLALCLGIVKHRLCNSVLNGACGVSPLDLDEQPCRKFFFLLDVSELYQRRCTDELFHRLIYFHFNISLNNSNKKGRHKAVALIEGILLNQGMRRQQHRQVQMLQQIHLADIIFIVIAP